MCVIKQAKHAANSAENITCGDNMKTIVPKTFHSSWNDFMNEQMISNLHIVDTMLPDNINPSHEHVMRFLNMDVSKIKVVILGQDPYYQPGFATGRCFEVGGLKSWNQPFRQVSLKNIVRLLYKTYNNINSYDDIPSYENIARKISLGEFKISPPSELFESWEKQGVLLLNTYLTCEQWKPNSHREIWGNFASLVIDYICQHNKNISWFVWGNEAKCFLKFITDGISYVSRHPMMCNKSYPNDFLKSVCFEKTMNTINWLC